MIPVAKRHSGVEEPGRPRLPHEEKTAGSNPAPATPVQWPTRRIRVADIDPNPWNPNRMSKENIEKLKRAVQDKGLGILGSLVVRPKGKRFEVVDGEHRWNIYKELGLQEVDAIVADLDDDHAKIAGLVLNELRGQLQIEPLSVELAGLLETQGVDRLASVLPWRENVLLQLAQGNQEEAVQEPWLGEASNLRVVVTMSQGDYDLLMKWAGSRGIHDPSQAVIMLIQEMCE